MKGGLMMTTATALVALVLAVACWGSVAGDAVGDECANEFPKVTTCLTFATGKADKPTKECCASVTDLKGRKPVCLCYIIQQIHDGSNPQIKSMGIQEARLLQLPSACQLTNASSSECPKLLGLPANSPDAAIFTSNTSAPASPGGAPSTKTPAAPDTSATSDGSNAASTHGNPPAAGVLATTVLAVFFLASPMLAPSLST